MTLISLLPLLRGWRYLVRDIDYPFVIGAGAERVIESVDKPGLLIAIMVSVDNPYADFIIRYYDPYKGIVEVNMIPYSLKLAGLDAPNPTGLWCSRYDDVNKIYTIVFSYQTGLPFVEKCTLSIRAPPISPVTVRNYSQVAIVIEDIDEFKRSLSSLVK